MASNRRSFIFLIFLYIAVSKNAFKKKFTIFLILFTNMGLPTLLILVACMRAPATYELCNVIVHQIVSVA